MHKAWLGITTLGLTTVLLVSNVKISGARAETPAVPAAPVIAPPALGQTQPQPLPLEESLKKARVDGKYAMLLQQIEAPQDFKEQGAFHDMGALERTEWAGVKDLPKGYWVYAYPYWYIWRDLTAAPQPKRNWGPEQVTGEPDTPQAGDRPTAWASRTPDGQEEWLLLEYDEPIAPKTIKIYETYNTGAVHKVNMFNLEGKEITVFEGQDTTPVGADKGVTSISGKVPFKTNRIKIYLDSPAVPGWNEIDAVGLVDADGKMHWATAAAASSTYAEQAATPITRHLVIADELIPLDPNVDIVPGVNDGVPGVNKARDTEHRIAQLEAEVASLKAQIAALKQAINQARTPAPGQPPAQPPVNQPEDLTDLERAAGGLTPGVGGRLPNLTQF